MVRQMQMHPKWVFWAIPDAVNKVLYTPVQHITFKGKVSSMKPQLSQSQTAVPDNLNVMLLNKSWKYGEQNRFCFCLVHMPARSHEDPGGQARDCQ